MDTQGHLKDLEVQEKTRNKKIEMDWKIRKSSSSLEFASFRRCPFFCFCRIVLAATLIWQKMGDPELLRYHISIHHTISHQPGIPQSQFHTLKRENLIGQGVCFLVNPLRPVVCSVDVLAGVPASEQGRQILENRGWAATQLLLLCFMCICS